MEKTYTRCQSCSMPFAKDQGQGGTNADGGKSKMYCSCCYQKGKFTRPDWTAKQMQQFCKEKLKTMGFPGFIAGFMTLGIPRLERWRNK